MFLPYRTIDPTVVFEMSMVFVFEIHSNFCVEVEVEMVWFYSTIYYVFITIGVQVIPQ